MGLREEKRSSTRAAIEYAAWTLAGDRPWAEITVDDIAAAAGISRRTFFNYVDSKDELLPAGGMKPGAFLNAVRARPMEEEPWDVLTAAVLETLGRYPRESIERMRAMWREPSLLEANVAGRRELERALVEEVRRRRPEISVTDALLLVAVHLTASRVAVSQWVAEGEPGSVVDAVAQAMRAVTISLTASSTTG